jgi:aminoglycoside phosphotransferase (APT) family kinase protein
MTTEMKRSSRDPSALREGLERWLQTKLAPGARPRVGEIGGTSATGMSSETLLFDATWDEDGASRTERLVARVAPSATDAPVFPSYDLDKQFRTIASVGELTDVPVPMTWWVESDPDVLGMPFFVMGRVDGEPPPDVMPYNFGDSWLYNASPDDQRRLQDASVDLLVRLHAIDDATQRFSFLAFDAPGSSPLHRHVAHTRAWYDWATRDGLRSPLVGRAFDWLDAHWPAAEGPAVLSWGDSRIGNVLYRDFAPVAVLDWEMAALGPRELDVAWMIYAHETFEHLAGRLGLGGMPDFMREADVVRRYTERAGVELDDLRFYRTYAGVQWAIVFLRTGFRAVRFGERDMPADVEEFLHNREQLEGMLT